MSSVDLRGQHCSFVARSHWKNNKKDHFMFQVDIIDSNRLTEKNGTLRKFSCASWLTLAIRCLWSISGFALDERDFKMENFFCSLIYRFQGHGEGAGTYPSCRWTKPGHNPEWFPSSSRLWMMFITTLTFRGSVPCSRISWLWGCPCAFSFYRNTSQILCTFEKL